MLPKIEMGQSLEDDKRLQVSQVVLETEHEEVWVLPFTPTLLKPSHLELTDLLGMVSESI